MPAPGPDAPQPGPPGPAVGRRAAGVVAGLRPSPLDVACLGPVLVGPFFSLAMLPVVPALVGAHPVLLETLTGSTASMVAARHAAVEHGRRRPRLRARPARDRPGDHDLPLRLGISVALVVGVVAVGLVRQRRG